MLKALVKFPFRVARRAVRRFTGAQDDSCKNSSAHEPSFGDAEEALAPEPAAAPEPEVVTQPIFRPAPIEPLEPQVNAEKQDGRVTDPVTEPVTDPVVTDVGENGATPNPAKPRTRRKGMTPVPAPSRATPPPAPTVLTVTPEPTPNPQVVKFCSSKKIVAKGSLSFNNAAVAAGNPIGEALFALPGVKMVFAVNDFVTVTKDESATWEDLTPRVKETLLRVLEDF